MGRPISDIKPRISVSNLDAVLREVLETLRVHEQEVCDDEGRSYLLRVRPYRTEDNHIDGAVLLLLDVTDLRRSMDEVKQARDYANAVIDTVREPLLVLDHKLAVRGANQAFYEFFVTEPQEVEGRDLYEIVGSQLDLPPVRRLLRLLLAGETQLRDVEIEHEFPRAGLRTMLLNARRISGSTDAILLAFEDITERKRAIEARYRRLFDSARDVIIIVEARSGEILDLNPFTEQLFGFSRTELIGRRLWETELPSAPQVIRAALDQARDQGVVQFSDVTFNTKDGRAIQTEFIANIYSEGDRQAIQLNVRDLTERRKFEREMQHTQKLESLGLLAGGVAHDFNNLLTGILGNASLVYSDMPVSSPLRPRIRDVITASERAADLTRQLLAYAGKGRFVMEQINLFDLIHEILVLIQSSIPKSVELKLDLNPDLPPLEADAAQIQQLIMNLVINGAEAIGEGRPGTVEIRTGLRELTAGEIRENFASDALTPGTYISLEVNDTGSGMDDATRARIFDPFFTTKFTGRGLGLAAASGIVKVLRGAIRVHSTPARGTSFYLLIPAVAPVRRVRRAMRPRKRLQGSGLVLVIDDEATVRDTARAMLERSGFEVMVAENGQDGVELFRSHSERVSLVILDLTMPVMGGEQAFDLLRAIRNDVPILLTSGYDEAEAASRTSGRDFAGFIHKPFDVNRLAEVVSSALRLTLED